MVASRLLIWTTLSLAATRLLILLLGSYPMLDKMPSPHFVLVPLMAQGHMIPMVDMARLLADRGVLVSIITTPVNAARIKPVIDRSISAGLPIRFVELDFPCAKAGLPDGCENFDLVPSIDLYKPFVEAFEFLREPLELYLRDADVPVASCLITDSCHWWTAEVARALGMPRFVFYGPSCFFNLCVHNIRLHDAYGSVVDDFEPVVIPGLPLRVEIAKAQAPGGWFCTPGWEDIHGKVVEAAGTADGVVINTFRDLEPEFLGCYEKAVGKSVWPIGPLSLYNKDFASMASRGNKASVDEGRLSSWLDSMEPGSVVYVSFGSLARNGPSQVVEIGRGLEGSGRPFVWAMKEAERCPEVEEWMAEGFEERTRGRGVVIAGWAPQVVILSHPSVGAFVTHCGWNSILEAVSAGVPMATWPFFADQFLNERLVVEVLRIGVSLGVKVPSILLKEEGEIAVRRDDVEKAIVSLMDGGEEGKERRERAKGFGEKARMAMEVGGTSYENLTLLIKFVTDHANRCE